MFGLLLLIALYKLSTSSQLAIAVFLYIFCPGVHYTRSKTFARASLFLSGVSVRQQFVAKAKMKKLSAEE
ncbi:hypothetical protein COOONC_13193 [Cooperia oncophora]